MILLRRSVLRSNEPKVDSASPDYTAQLASAFSYYNMNGDKKEARAYIRDYLKATDKTGKLVKKLDDVPDYNLVATYGWLARIVSNGFGLSKLHEDNFKQYLSNLLSTSFPKKQAQITETPKPTIQDYMKEKTREYIGELEGVLDDVIKTSSEFNLYNDLRLKQIPKAYSADILVWIEKKTKEYVSVYNASDSDVKESYSNIGKRKLTALVKTLQQFEEDLQKYSDYKKANRKIRAKKVKSPFQQIAKLKYKKEDVEARVQSISPADMVGASQVWIYNSKYKKLAVYRTESSMGIQVKGSTLQNYDPELCEQKTVRRPEAFLPTVIKATKVQLRKVMDNLTTKGSDVNGRINEECIILRAIR